ncbi:hypothetical protein FISHEDRAFT_33652 [Fistulina hepatica ATCC 64428]|uniref:DUF3533 domain-containing protein n=1 Tax=Fistulina hepatica ATCC 64428 TaxID=1128425 RepID=A0A0D7AN97_9AGAR|nr:hypothetical protein FISHEDRAFT_33652 [Fistulina hepatica ATCC 64428]
MSYSDAPAAKARKIYFRLNFGALVTMIIVIIFCIFPIYWGALWKIPDHQLSGWVVDFDGGTIGTSVAQAIVASSSSSYIAWISKNSSEFPGGVEQLAQMIVDEHAWAAIAINENATSRLEDAVITANASYNGSSAITAFGVEARSENGYRMVVRPTIVQTMQEILQDLAGNYIGELVSMGANLTEIASSAPQLIATPVSYTLDNLRPFDVPVAMATTFVGMLYIVVIAFYVSLIGFGARLASDLDVVLTYGSLVRVKLVSCFAGYFMLSLAYSLLNLAFQVPFDRRFGHAGFVIFWMFNYLEMLALGLATEAMFTLLTLPGMPFFLLLWVISNVSVLILPIEVMPNIYRYGYAWPIYNTSRSILTIIFGTKNEIGFNVGVLIAWIAVSCITLPLFELIVRRRSMKRLSAEGEPSLPPAQTANRQVNEPRERRP